MKPTFDQRKDLINNPQPKHYLDRPTIQPAEPVDQSPRALVNAWLESIGASNAEIAEVIDQCEHNKEARAYYVRKATGTAPETKG